MSAPSLGIEAVGLDIDNDLGGCGGGRTAFAATSGSRWLQGCYADIDGLRSTIAVLSREVLT